MKYETELNEIKKDLEAYMDLTTNEFDCIVDRIYELMESQQYMNDTEYDMLDECYDLSQGAESYFQAIADAEHQDELNDQRKYINATR